MAVALAQATRRAMISFSDSYYNNIVITQNEVPNHCSSGGLCQRNRHSQL
jgi:hypothetical protein